MIAISRNKSTIGVKGNEAIGIISLSCRRISRTMKSDSRFRDLRWADQELYDKIEEMPGISR